MHRTIVTQLLYAFAFLSLFFFIDFVDELSAAATLLAKLPALDGKIITADPLHCQRKTASVIVEKGGDYLLQIKGNQPNLLKQARGFDALPGTPFLPRSNPDTGGSRSGTCTPSPSNRSRPTSLTPGP